MPSSFSNAMSGGAKIGLASSVTIYLTDELGDVLSLENNDGIVVLYGDNGVINNEFIIYKFLSSGGTSGGGSASNNLIKNPQTSNSQIINETMSGGSLGGGTATTRKRTSVVATGGSLGGGTATILSRNSNVATGGSLGSGTATIRGSTSVVATGGSLCSGTATIRGSTRFVATGGSLCSGNASRILNKNVIMSGGCLVNGSIFVSCRFDLDFSVGNEVCLIKTDLKKIYKPFTKNKIDPNETQFKGLVACWDSTIPSSSNFYDRISGNNISLAGLSSNKITWNVDPTRGQVLGFNGTTGSYSATSNNAYASRVSSTITVSVWIKKLGTGLGHECVYNNSIISLYLDYNDTTEVHALAVISGVTIDLNLGNINTGEWYNITTVYDGSNFIGYKNGVEITRSSQINALNSITGVLYLGASDASSSNAANARIDDLRIYNRPLSSSEVSQLYLPQTSYSLWTQDAYTIIAPSYSSSAAVRCGGEVPRATYEIGSGGSLGAGLATVNVGRDVVPTGGSLGAGLVAVNVGRDVMPTGGSLGAGLATPTATYSVMATSGALSGGFALQVFYDIVETAGGCLCGGISGVNVFREIATTGGALVGGTAQQTFNSTARVFGGCRGGGIASLALSYNFIATNGSLLSGTAISSAIYRFISSGNGLIGGIVTPNIAYSITTSRGSLAGGTAIQAFTDIAETSGGSLSGGVAVANVQYNMAATSGTLISGFATSTINRNVTPTGGTLASSNATVAFVYKVIATGGVSASGTVEATGTIVSGEAIPTVYYRVTLTGGALSGVTATPNTYYNISINGGGSAGGRAIQTFVDIAETSGGVVTNGTATQNLINSNYQIFNETMTGGCKTSGESSQLLIFVIGPSKGVLIAGIVAIEFTHSPSMFGGMTGSGLAFASRNFSRIVTFGGVRCLGSSIFNKIYNYDPTLNTNLLLYFKFDESGGTNIIDSSIYNRIANVGSYANTNVTVPELKFLNSSVFNATSEISTNIDLNKRTGLTVCFWFKYTDYDTFGNIFYSDVCSINFNYSYELVFEIKTNFGGNAFYISQDDLFTIREWHHMCFSWDASTNVFTFHRNGELIESHVVGGDYLQQTFGPSFNFAWIAMEDQYYPYYLDDFRIYDRKLTNNEISRLASGYDLKNSLLANSSAEVDFKKNYLVSGGLSPSGVALVTAKYTSSMRGGINVGGQIVTDYKEEMSGGGLIGGSAEIEIVLKRKHVSSGRRLLIQGGANYTRSQNSLRYEATGELLSIESDSIFTLSYFDDPCPDYFENGSMKLGFNCLAKQPNDYINCQKQQDFYGQCVVLKGRTSCPNKEAKLSPITLCRQGPYLPSKALFRR